VTASKQASSTGTFRYCKNSGGGVAVSGWQQAMVFQKATITSSKQ